MHRGLGQKRSAKFFQMKSFWDNRWMNPADFRKTTGGGVIPNLGRVSMAADRPVSAKAIDRLFGTPHEDLYGGSSRDWPIAGDDLSASRDLGDF